MSGMNVQQMADRVAQMMQDRLSIRGRGLDGKLRHARGVMPKRVQAEAAYLARAAETARDPRMMARIDQARIVAAYQTCMDHLNAVGRAARVTSITLSIASSVAFRLLVVFGLLVWFLVWKGYV